MDREQAEAAGRAAALILNETLSRLDKLNNTLAEMLALQQARLDNQQESNQKMIGMIEKLREAFAPPRYDIPDIPETRKLERCPANTGEEFHGIQCNLAAGHTGHHSAMVMWTDEPGPSKPQ